MPVEFNLIADELSEIDLSLERAEQALNWNSEGKLKSGTNKTIRFLWQEIMDVIVLVLPLFNTSQKEPVHGLLEGFPH